MGKRILIIKGSPREQGNSSVLADQVAEGAGEAGATTESIFLHGMDIRPCRGCDNCRATRACLNLAVAPEVFGEETASAFRRRGA